MKRIIREANKILINQIKSKRDQDAFKNVKDFAGITSYSSELPETTPMR